MKEKQKLSYVKSNTDIISCGTEEENKVSQDNTNTHNMIKDTVSYVIISPYLIQDQLPVKLDLSLLKYGLENMTEPKVLDCKFLSCMSLREYLPTFKDVDLFKIELFKRTLPPLAVSWNMNPRCIG